MKTRPIILTALALLAALILTACGGATASAPPMPEMAPMATAAPAAPAAEAPAVEQRYEAGGGAVDGSAGQPNQPAQPAERLVIKTAQIAIQVDDVRAADQAIRDRAAQLGGYVVSVQTSGSDEYLTATVVFRVPAERFDEALGGVQGLAKRVLSNFVTGDDVTEEFVDLESRLRNLEATRTRLLDLLAKANRVEDALQVNNALTDVQGQIEQIQGRMKYLRQSAAMSTISVSLEPVPPQPTIIEEDSWQPLRVARGALRELVQFGQGIVELLIVVGVWTPVWLPIGLVGWWGWRRVTGRGRKAKAPPAA